MPLTLVSTLSSEIANSYVDLAFANDYWTNHYNSTLSAQWAGLSDSKKTTLLIKACRTLENFRFTEKTYRYPYSETTIWKDRSTGLIWDIPKERTPVKADYKQALQFPRQIDRDSSGALFIPEPVKMAQCEQALYLLSFDDSVLSSSAQGVQSERIKVGPIEIEQKMQEKSSGSQISPSCKELISGYLLRSSARFLRR